MTDHPTYHEAIQRFGRWLDVAKTSDEPEPTAMTLATAGADGRLSARTVLLKQFDDRGFVFYTNLDSLKGRQLNQNPTVALCFLWKSLERQVRIEGQVQQVSDETADAYFASRPRGSQIGAWASKQSSTLDKRETFEQAIAEAEQRFEDAQVSRPEFWSGFRVIPTMIEFWQGREYRLHDRWLYELSEGQWTQRMLYP